MDESIKLRSLVQAKVIEDARKQFIKGAGRDSHGMNPGSAAIDDFQAEYDRLERAQRQAEFAVDQLLSMAMVMETPT
jgi:hypothetical protein